MDLHKVQEADDNCTLLVRDLGTRKALSGGVKPINIVTWALNEKYRTFPFLFTNPVSRFWICITESKLETEEDTF